MLKKILSSLVLMLLLTTGDASVQAELLEGKFIPGKVKKPITANIKSKYYQIKTGDTLWGISRVYGVDLPTLMAINELQPESILKVGQTVRLPTDNTRQHLIRKGETMWSIAAKYDVDLKEMCRLNKSIDPHQLKIGDQLVVPEGAVRVIPVMTEPSRSLERGFLTWPVQGNITSGYGWRKSGFHHGLDIAAEVGTPVKAAGQGRVDFAGSKDIYGKTIIIEHNDEQQTLYAHLSRFKVGNGQAVSRGQVIGYIGVTGRTTGPHLHFSVFKDEKTYDPVIFLRK